MTDTIGLLLKLALDESSKQQAEKGMKDVAKTVDAVVESADALSKREKELKEAIKASEKEMDIAVQKAKTYGETLGKLQKMGSASAPQYAGLQKQYEDQASAISKTLIGYKDELEAIKKLQKEKKDLARYTGMSVKELDALSPAEYAIAKAAMEAQQQINKLNKEFTATRREVQQLNRFAGAIGQISTAMFASGTAVIGGLYLAANKEAERIKQSGEVVDATTQRWLNSQERIKVSYQRMGRVAETALLPLLEKVSALAEKGSKFVEDHPDLIKAAINTGAVLAAVGTVGMLVSKGVRFYADMKLISAELRYEYATGVFDKAVDKYMGASAGGLGGVGGGKGGGIGKTLGTVTLIATSVILGAEIGKALGNAIAKGIYGSGYKDQGFGDTARTYYRAASLPGQALALQLKEWGVISDETAKKIADLVHGTDEFIGKVVEGDDALAGLTDGLDEMSAAAKRAENETKGMDVLDKLEKDNIEAEREFQQERSRVMAQASRETSKASDDFKNAIDKIKDSLKDTLSKLAYDFASESNKAEVDYKNEYSKTVSDGNEEILSIRKNAMDELRKLEEDFAAQSDELTRARDALGLVKAQREFEKNKSEITNRQKEEISESQRQTKIRLDELKRSFEQERAERLAKYKQDVIDAREKAKQDQLDAKEAYEARRKEISAQMSAELSELQRAYNEERRRRVLAAYDQIKDLGDSLNAERILRQKYYQLFVQEAQNILNSLHRTGGGAGASSTGSGNNNNNGGFSGVSGGGMAGTRQAGGPIGNTGMYLLHKGEHVLSPENTSAASRLIGGQVSQQAMLMMMAMGRQNSFSMTDQRRFDASIPAGERRAIEEDSAARALDMFTALVGNGRS